MKRENGFYWVKCEGEWITGRLMNILSGKLQAWAIFGEDGWFSVDDESDYIDEIGPKIEQPHD